MSMLTKLIRVSGSESRRNFNIELSTLVRRMRDDKVGTPIGECDNYYYPSSIIVWKRAFMPNTSKEKGRKIFFWRIMLNLGIIRVHWKVLLPF